MSNGKCEGRPAVVTSDDVADRLMSFGVRAGKVVDALPDTRLGRHIAGQLVRCATSPIPNYEKSRAAASRADFVHKRTIVLKELRESVAWLTLSLRAELLPASRLTSLIDEGEQLKRMIAKSIVSTRQRGLRD